MIMQFRNENYFLSNFYETEIEFEGIKYKNAESAFQAQKCTTEEEKKRFCNLSGSQAKSLGKKVNMRSDWNKIRVLVMTKIIIEKFSNAELRKLLLNTGDKILVEGNTWNDKFWGVDLKTNQGKNYLGRILMYIRDEFKNEIEKH